MNTLIDRTLFRRVAAVALASACFAMAGCSEMLSREDFAARVKDKSDKEVVKEVGKPAAVADIAPDQVAWTYNKRTFDIAQNNKFDTQTVIVFSKGGSNGQLKAMDVKFE